MLCVKQLPCAARALGTCEGLVEADHQGRRPYGRKCSDRETAPMCTRHHREREAFAGAFKNWDHDRMRAWLDAQIAATQAQLMAPGEDIDRARERAMEE
jgi:hypothetical protein